jgi:hypothetical protein
MKMSQHTCFPQWRPPHSISHWQRENPLFWFIYLLRGKYICDFCGEQVGYLQLGEEQKKIFLLRQGALIFFLCLSFYWGINAMDLNHQIRSFALILILASMLIVPSKWR